MKEFILASGNKLRVSKVPFSEARLLYQALMLEMKNLKVTTKDEFANLAKDLFCIGFSSPQIDQRMQEIFKRCQYCDDRGELKIDADTFEPEQARGDYVQVYTEVVKEVCGPFLKGLYAQFEALFEMVQGIQK